MENYVMKNCVRRDLAVVKNNFLQVNLAESETSGA